MSTIVKVLLERVQEELNKEGAAGLRARTLWLAIDNAIQNKDDKTVVEFASMLMYTIDVAYERKEEEGSAKTHVFHVHDKDGTVKEYYKEDGSTSDYQLKN